MCPGPVERGLSEPRWAGLHFPFSLPSPPAPGSRAAPSLGQGDSTSSSARSLEEKYEQALGILASPSARLANSHMTAVILSGQRTLFLLPAHELHRHPPSPSVTLRHLRLIVRGAHSRLFPGSMLRAAGSICPPCCSVFPWLVGTSFIPFSLALSKYSCPGTNLAYTQRDW